MARCQIPPLSSLTLLIFLTAPIITNTEMIIAIVMITITIGIVITATIETPARI